MAPNTRISRLVQLLSQYPDITLDELAARLALPVQIICSDLQALG